MQRSVSTARNIRRIRGNTSRQNCFCASHIPPIFGPCQPVRCAMGRFRWTKSISKIWSLGCFATPQTPTRCSTGPYLARLIADPIWKTSSSIHLGSKTEDLMSPSINVGLPESRKRSSRAFITSRNARHFHSLRTFNCTSQKLPLHQRLPECLRRQRLTIHLRLIFRTDLRRALGNWYSMDHSSV